MSTQKITDGTVLVDTSAATPPAATTLNGAINNSVTAITVTSGANVVDGTYITILAEAGNTTETVLVSSGGGTVNLVAVRAQLGTAASAHSTLAVVNLPGAVVFTLLTIAQVPNRELFVRKATSDIHYVDVTAGGGNTFPDGSTVIRLRDSGPNGTAHIKFPGTGNVLIVLASGSGTMAGPGGAAGPAGPSATAPPGVTSVSPPTITVDAKGNVVLLFDITYPVSLGTMTDLYIRVERPYFGTLPEDTATNVPPAFAVDDLGPFPLVIVSGAVTNTQAYITLPAPFALETWAAWFSTASPFVRNVYTDASAFLVTFDVSPTAGLIAGAEWAANPPNPIGVIIERQVRRGAEHWWRPHVTWALPTDDPRFSNVAQWDIGLLDPEIVSPDVEQQIISLGLLSPTTVSFAGGFARVQDHAIRFVLMVRPVTADGHENSYVPGVTAALAVVIGQVPTGPGREQADVVSAVTAVSSWQKDPTGAREFTIDVAWTNPVDVRFGGVILQLVSTGDFAAPPGQIVTAAIPAGTTSCTIVLAQKDGPKIAGTWTVIPISVDANNEPNTYVSGVTPEASCAVLPWFTGAPTLQASGFSVTYAYTDYDYNGIPELSLTVNFTPPDPAVDPSWAYVDFWAQRPDDGLWYNYFSPDKSGMIYAIGQLPKATGTWNFRLVDKDVNGKDLAGNSTTDPAAPPAGSAMCSPSIAPPGLGASGVEYAANVTSPSVTIGSPVAQPDGTYKELVTLAATLPTDSRFGGYKVIVKYTSGALNNKLEEIADIAAPRTGADIIWTPPAGSITSDWYFISYNKLGQLNTIQAGTPKVTKTVGSTSQLDFSAVKLSALNLNLLRLNPATGLFEPYQIEQAIYAVLQLGGGTANGVCNTSGTAVTGTSGSSFTSGMVGLPFYVNGVAYTVQSYTDATHLTLSTSAGTQTGKNWSFGRSPQFKIFDRNNVQIGFWGDDGFNTGFVGLYAGKDVRLGGNIADGGLLEVDTVGNEIGLGGVAGSRIMTISDAAVSMAGTDARPLDLELATTGTGGTAYATVNANGGGEANLAFRVTYLDQLSQLWCLGTFASQGTPGAPGTGTYKQYQISPNGLSFSTDDDATPWLEIEKNLGSPGHLYLSHGTVLDVSGALYLDALIASFNNVNTAGMGVPPIYATVALTGRTASIGATNLQVGGGIAPAGLYRVTVYGKCTTAGGGIFTVNILFNDGTAARTNSLGISLASTTFQGIIYVVKTDGSANIQYSVTLTGVTGSPVYALDIAMERLT